MNVGSLFSGVGGLDLGLERAGMTVRWQAEVDVKCLDLLAAKWPGVTRYSDVKEVDGRAADVDLICGGFPCQDVSVAGRREGLGGKRSGLWWEFHRVVAECHPAWVLIENVPGLLSSNGGRDMGAIIGALGDLGYGFAWRVLDAQWFGLAQRRKRLFIVGCAGGDGRRAAEVLLESEGGSGDAPTRGTAGQDVAHALRASTRGSDDADRGTFIPELSYALRARSGGVGQAWNVDHIAVGVSTQGTGGAGSWAHDLAMPVTGSHGDGIVAVGVASNQRGEIRQATIVGSVLQGARVRRLMPIERERLQGFPDGWTAGYPDSTRERMTGNAVAVPVAEWIGRRIIMAAAA